MQSLAKARLDERWLSVDEISVYLGVKRDTVYKWISRKYLPAHKVGRLWKFRKKEIDDWVCSDKTAATPLDSRDLPRAEGGLD